MNLFDKTNPLCSNTERVLEDIHTERFHRNEEWGIQNHALIVWLGILSEEFGEAAKEINEFHFRKGSLSQIRQELIQVAAVATAIIETIDICHESELLLRESKAR